MEELALAARPMRELTDAELQRWMWACLRLSKCERTWFRRWRGRRAWSRAMTASSRRTSARLGAGPLLCQRCSVQKPTVHIAYDRGPSERYGHFCRDCSRHEPHGWFVRADV